MIQNDITHESDCIIPSRTNTVNNKTEQETIQSTIQKVPLQNQEIKEKSIKASYHSEFRASCFTSISQ